MPAPERCSFGPVEGQCGWRVELKMSSSFRVESKEDKTMTHWETNWNYKKPTVRLRNTKKVIREV